jgi:hypothetical protein
VGFRRPPREEGLAGHDQRAESAGWRSSRFPFPRRCSYPPRSRHRPVPQGERSGNPRQRRRVQRRREPGRLLRAAGGSRHRDGRLPHRRSGRRAAPGHGRQAVLPPVRARRSARP